MIVNRPICFILGAFIAFSLNYFIPRKNHGELRDKGSDSSVFGIEHTYGEAARALVLTAGIPIPENAFDCYYSLGGINPVLEFIAFSLPKEKMSEALYSISNKTDIQLYPSIKPMLSPDCFGSENRTILYDLSKVANPKQFEWTLKSECHATCIIDEENARIFVLVTPK